MSVARLAIMSCRIPGHIQRVCQVINDPMMSPVGIEKIIKRINQILAHALLNAGIV